ncbi:hypothetical protein [Hymenobacter cellulosilyticus]|uniref:Uncharacterized protein n=1 Tax=Hymenobacter cellulosilyticus TaxID=2932248 RepID=A0A8T9QE83_9BACT|nr:hypothetical protein [Hymenobacter cellulosilyticus]UOQ74721.1 hypothetical protein MUN79_13095 [Hymenobacter cellulosilyticus]
MLCTWPRLRLLRAVFLLTLLLGGPVGSRAQRAPAPTTILFVGNSFLHGRYNPVFSYNSGAITIERVGKQKTGEWGGIPAIFKKFADQAGLPYEVHFQCINGESLKLHYDSAQLTLQQPRWHTVVLQEHSMWPLPTRRGGRPSTFRDYSTRIEQAVHTANPAARLYFYQTWARADQTYLPGKAYSGLPLDSMTHDLHRGYYEAARANGRFAGVAPAGDAWLRAVQTGVAQRNPYQPEPGKLDLWGEDNYHPGTAGAYLSACVLFGEITDYDPRRLGSREEAAAALGLLPEQAVALQRVAAEQVLAARPRAFSVAHGPRKARKNKVKVKAKTDA